MDTEPPQFCHGSGKTIEDSHDMAALFTLNLLSELGLDNVRPKKNAGADSQHQPDVEQPTQSKTLKSTPANVTNGAVAAGSSKK